ncbi:MAG: RNA polymerase sigma factor [Planctomycetota bacterium]
MDEPTRFLVQRAQRDDRDALATLLSRYRARVRAALERMLGEAMRQGGMDGDDAAQDAIVAAMAGIHAFEHRGEGSFLAWLLQTARNEVRQRLRRQHTLKRGSNSAVDLDAVSEPRSAEPSPSQVARARELEERIEAALVRLPAAEREVIVLRRYLDASFDEIAAELELPTAGAARALLSRAQVRLARELEGTPG